MVGSAELLSDADTPPFEIESFSGEVSEEMRLKYRYLDLRRDRMREAMELRHRVTRAMREFLSGEGFLEIETPVLTRSTPEGARDFLVPSRLQRGSLLRAAAVAAALQAAPDDRRLRALLPDRPLLPRRGPARRPPARLHPARHRDVVRRGRGRDRRQRADARRTCSAPAASRSSCRSRACPTTRRSRATAPTSPTCASASRWSRSPTSSASREFKAFKGAIDGGAVVRALNVGQARDVALGARRAGRRRPRSSARRGSSGRSSRTDGWRSPVAKFLSEEEISKANEALERERGRRPADRRRRRRRPRRRSWASCAAASGERLGLIAEGAHSLAWIVDWPLVEWNEEEGRWDPLNHPFTSPDGEFRPRQTRATPVPRLTMSSGTAGKSAVDRSVSTTPSCRRRVFTALGIDDAQAEERFGFLLDALRYGAPPHGGIAYGVDRIAALAARSGVDPRRDRLPEDGLGLGPADRRTRARRRRSSCATSACSRQGEPRRGLRG